VSVCADALFALEQSHAPATQRILDANDIHSSLEKCKSLLTLLREAATSQTSPTSKVDAFSFQLIDNLRKRTTTNSTQLVQILSEAVQGLGRGDLDPRAADLIRIIGEEGSTIAERSLEGMKPS